MKFCWALMGLMFALHASAETHSGHYLDRVKYFESDKGTYDVTMVGDSITEYGKWQTLLPGTRIANRGIAGDTIEGVLERLPSIQATNAKRIFVMIGVNDLLSGQRTADEIVPSYESLIENLQETGALVFVQSTLYTDRPGKEKTNAQIGILNRAIANFCFSRSAVFVDLNSVLSKDDHLREDVTVDQLHLNPLGYSLWAARIQSQVPAASH